MRLGDYIDVLSGYAFKSKQFNTEGKGIQVVRIRDVGKERSETYYDGEYKEDFILNNGDLLIGMDGDFRLSEWKGGKALLNQRVCKITVGSNDLYRNYLMRMLPRELKRIEDTTSFATVKHLSVKKINDIDLPLPPLEEQKKIAAILDAADDYRQKTKALIDKYDQLTQSLFLDMFGDPVTNPKGWDVKPISKLTDNFNSQRVPLKSSDRAVISGNIPYYGASGIIDFVDDYTHDGEYVLIGEDGANLISRNKPIAFLAKGKIWVNNHAHVLKNTNESRLEFIEFLINSIDLEPYVTGSAQPKLNKGNLDRIKVYAPPVCLQDEFAERVALIEKQKQLAEASLVKAEELFNSLLQKAFKGELTN